MSRFQVCLLMITLPALWDCTDQPRVISRTYTGFWAETRMTYEFSLDNAFTFTTAGHYGNTTTSGRYAIIDSVILLHPFSEKTLRAGVLKPRLFIVDSPGCIRDEEHHYYCDAPKNRNKVFEEGPQTNDDTITRLSREYPLAIDSLIAIFYRALSGKGRKNWSPLREICLPTAQFNAMGINLEGRNEWYPNQNLDSYLHHLAPYAEANGFYQTERYREVQYFNKIAQVWSAYESRNTPDGEIIDRGMYSFQLVEMEGSWKIANVLWNSETEEHPAPAY